MKLPCEQLGVVVAWSLCTLDVINMFQCVFAILHDEFVWLSQCGGLIAPCRVFRRKIWWLPRSQKIRTWAFRIGSYENKNQILKSWIQLRQMTTNTNFICPLWVVWKYDRSGDCSTCLSQTHHACLSPATAQQTCQGDKMMVRVGLRTTFHWVKMNT